MKLRQKQKKYATMVALLAFLTVGTSSYAQGTRSIGGIVKDETGEPLPGATVVQKRGGKSELQHGVICDINGHFSLSLPTNTEAIEVSYIGYKTLTVTLTQSSSYEIILTPDIISLGEVVVTGLFTRKASTYTGSVTAFGNTELKQAGNVNVIQSLRNLDPAFQIIDNLEIGSDPNALPNLTIRGATGLPDFRDQYATEPNQPLFILDGFETTLQNVIDLDMTRIKSVTLLKDAASKAIYGAQAANGIVVIETERPTAGQLRVNYNYVANIQTPDLSSYDLTNAAEKLEIELAGGVYSSGAVGVPFSNTAQRALDEQYAARLAMVLSGVDTDWLSKPLRNGIGGRHSLAVSGGDQAFLYNVQLSYNDTKGVMKGSDRKVYGGNIDLNYRAKKFSFRNQLSVDLNESNNSQWGSFSQYTLMNPYFAYTDENGNILKTVAELASSNSYAALTAYNPAYNATLSGIDKATYTQLINNFSVDWHLATAWRIMGSLNLTKQLNSSDVYLPADHTSFASATTEEEILRRGSYVKGNGFLTNVTGRLQASYAKVIADKHSVTLNAIGDIRSNTSDNVTVSTRGFPNDKLNDIRFALEYLQNTTPSGTESTTHDVGFSGSGNYSWDERAIADFSYRTNASSQYGRNSRWGSFWSAGIGWNFHNEEFVRNLGFVHKLQLRATTGYTGSQGFSSGMSMSTYNYELDQLYNGSYGTLISNLANPDLKWQRRYDNNFGINLGLWKKLDVVFDYYIANTDGLVTSITLPPSVGWTTVNANLGKLQNKGFDLRANYRVYSNSANKSSLSVYLTASRNTSILKEIANGLDTWNDEQDALSNNPRDAASSNPKVRFIEGQSMNSIWAVRSLGIDPGTGNEVYLKRNGEITYTWSADDQVVAGTTEADLMGNFGVNWSYKGFNVSAAMRYRFGGQMYNSTLVSKVENADIRQNVDRRLITGRWRQPGDITYFKALSSTLNTQPTTRFVEDNNTLTLASLSVSYDFQELRQIKAWGLSRLRVTASTADLFEWASTTIERGTAYPFARTMQLSLNASF